ncbi:uncharacterized protein MELLADRAFT_71465 [Melampsora larici-populina 98AG31]|uniref:C2H2-type domain-containing protein n=1 Tax=Melampsora larici-populina (strain 98AG31 / pathotype 3-4-7) TaxID=747676 RepID=F4RGX8_MELLP|nr:uncharacterized protein MELLADRAFT_71465 [Melampsora larici-populina 98AG31]EGG08130.1 hypothetical protein MELLADRAFT_71465 [Melampsora larici-populina 98AG31]
MSQQNYEPCFSFSVPPGKPTDPAYADPTPILSNRDINFNRQITTAVSSTSEPSTSSPFAFSILSESSKQPIPTPKQNPKLKPNLNHRNSLPNQHSYQPHHPSSPKDSKDLQPNESKRIKLEPICWNRSLDNQESLHQTTTISNQLCSPTHPHPHPHPIHHQSHLPNQIEYQKPFCLQAVPTQRKRPRRRFEEIERLYGCLYPGCTKAYGTLNHLNAHVLMQKHGKKRLPEEFKEVRREWRLRKRFNGNIKDDRGTDECDLKDDGETS